MEDSRSFKPTYLRHQCTVENDKNPPLLFDLTADGDGESRSRFTSAPSRHLGFNTIHLL
jgi:hypothetical protein